MMNWLTTTYVAFSVLRHHYHSAVACLDSNFFFFSQLLCNAYYHQTKTHLHTLVFALLSCPKIQTAQSLISHEQLASASWDVQGALDRFFSGAAPAVTRAGRAPRTTAEHDFDVFDEAIGMHASYVHLAQMRGHCALHGFSRNTLPVERFFV